jgi:hypothetical protein
VERSDTRGEAVTELIFLVTPYLSVRRAQLFSAKCFARSRACHIIGVMTCHFFCDGTKDREDRREALKVSRGNMSGCACCRKSATQLMHSKEDSGRRYSRCMGFRKGEYMLPGADQAHQGPPLDWNYRVELLELCARLGISECNNSGDAIAEIAAYTNGCASRTSVRYASLCI